MHAPVWLGTCLFGPSFSHFVCSGLRLLSSPLRWVEAFLCGLAPFLLFPLVPWSGLAFSLLALVIVAFRASGCGFSLAYLFLSLFRALSIARLFLEPFGLDLPPSVLYAFCCSFFVCLGRRVLPSRLCSASACFPVPFLVFPPVSTPGASSSCRSFTPPLAGLSLPCPCFPRLRPSLVSGLSSAALLVLLWLSR